MPDAFQAHHCCCQFPDRIPPALYIVPGGHTTTAPATTAEKQREETQQRSAKCSEPKTGTLVTIAIWPFATPSQIMKSANQPCECWSSAIRLHRVDPMWRLPLVDSWWVQFPLLNLTSRKFIVARLSTLNKHVFCFRVCITFLCTIVLPSTPSSTIR